MYTNPSYPLSSILHSTNPNPNSLSPLPASHTQNNPSASSRIPPHSQLKLSDYLWRWYVEKKKQYEKLKDEEDASCDVKSTGKRKTKLILDGHLRERNPKLFGRLPSKLWASVNGEYRPTTPVSKLRNLGFVMEDLVEPEPEKQGDSNPPALTLLLILTLTLQLILTLIRSHTPTKTTGQQ